MIIKWPQPEIPQQKQLHHNVNDPYYHKVIKVSICNLASQGDGAKVHKAWNLSSFKSSLSSFKSRKSRLSTQKSGCQSLQLTSSFVKLPLLEPARSCEINGKKKKNKKTRLSRVFDFPKNVPDFPKNVPDVPIFHSSEGSGTVTWRC